MDLDILQYNTLLMNLLSLIFSSVSQVKLNVNISVLVILGEILEEQSSPSMGCALLKLLQFSQSPIRSI